MLHILDNTLTNKTNLTMLIDGDESRKFETIDQALNFYYRAFNVSNNEVLVYSGTNLVMSNQA